MSSTDRRALEERLRREGRLPPGQSLTLKFPALQASPIPSFDPATWDFRIWGEVEQPVRWTWEAFQQLPRVRVVMDIHCVTRWSKFDTVWEGVSVRTLVEQGFIKLKPTARYVIQPGDTLSAIAARHRVSVASLRSENRLQGDRIRVGQVLRIPRT